MAGKTATLTVKIVSDAKGASQGFADAETRVDKFQRGLDKASVAAGGVLVGIGAIAKGAFDAASAAEQSAGAIGSVFGDAAGEIEAASKKAAQAVGLSASAYQNSAALLGAQLKGLGFTTDENVAKTQDLIAVGADLAATFGGSTQDAVNALSSALKGERDPIEAYGISLTQAGIDAQVAAMGLDTSTAAAERNAQAVATMALITAQGGGAMGAFGREADTAAGAQQRANAEFENAQAALGEVLLPVVAAAMTQFAGFTAALVENKGTVIPLVATIAALAGIVLAVNAAMKTYAAVQGIVTAVTWAWNAALLANPVVLVVAAIVALVAAVYLAYQRFETFRNIVKSVWEWLKKAFEFAGKVGSAIGDFFSAPATGGQAAAGEAGMYGAAAGGGEWAPIRGAAMGSPSGGTSPSAGRGQAGMVVNVTFNGPIDPVASGRQLEKVLRDYGRATGREVSLALTR